MALRHVQRRKTCVVTYRTPPPPQIASLVTTAAMEVATGARRMSGQDRLAMGPG